MNTDILNGRMNYILLTEVFDEPLQSVPLVVR